MTTKFRRVIHTVDCHAEGNPTRVIVGGVPVPPGGTLVERRDWMWAHDDSLRRMLNFEPRGSSLMCAVLLMPPVTPDSQFSVMIMEQDEYVPMSGHNLIGTATVVVATGMVSAVEPVTTVRFDTIAGPIVCEVEMRDGKVGAVSLTNVESFLLHDRIPLQVPEVGELIIDVAYGGEFYCQVDADALGIELAPHNDGQMIAMANRVIPALSSQYQVVHPLRADIDRCYQTTFMSAQTTTGDYKSIIVAPPGALDRSPCGTGSCARLATFFARGQVGLNQPVRFEGPLGTIFTCEAVSAEETDGITYIVPRLAGRAWITGMHEFILDPDDPLPEGFRIGLAPKPAPKPAS